MSWTHVLLMLYFPMILFWKTQQQYQSWGFVWWLAQSKGSFIYSKQFSLSNNHSPSWYLKSFIRSLRYFLHFIIPLITQLFLFLQFLRDTFDNFFLIFVFVVYFYNIEYYFDNFCIIFLFSNSLSYVLFYHYNCINKFYLL